jgi:hypothetical protein
MSTGAERFPRLLAWAYGTLGAIACVTFGVVAFVFAVTIPYHEWDAFAYGEWSRQIALSGAFDPANLQSPPLAARPVFYVLQGLLWSLTGVSFSAGRLLSLVFCIIAVGATAMLVGRNHGRVFAAMALLSFPLFSDQAISGKTDVPAAASVAAVSAVALASPFKRQPAAVAALALLAVLTKASSVVPALAGLGLALLLVERPRSFSRLRASRFLALTLGALVGISYEWAMAAHMRMGLYAFLRSGTTGYYAQLAHSLRLHTLLTLDFLGADLRLPLAFAFVYAAGRSVGVSHRSAAWLALLGGGAYVVVGPYTAGVHNGPFETPDAGFAFVGFALALAAVPFASSALQPDRTRTTQLFLIALPPTVVWSVFGIYENRLEAPAWPALAALIGMCLACSVRVTYEKVGVASLALVPVLLIALWSSLASFDGFHGPMWTEYRSLGVSGMWDRARTTNIVLPAVSETVAALRTEIGTDGKIVASDPHFLYWFPNMTTAYPTKCSSLQGEDGFILSTGDDSQRAMRQAGGSPDPSDWAACKVPRLRQLTDGSNGLAAFVVIHSS